MIKKPHTLPNILQENLPAFQALCLKHKIKKLWAFGSVLREDFAAESDVDFLHEWDEENISDQDYLENYYDFITSLRQLLNRKIDFVHYPSLKNPYFIQEIDKTKVLIYAQKPKKIPV